MKSHHPRSDRAVARRGGVAAPRIRSGGEHADAPFDLPLEQVVALAQFPREGIAESQLDLRLGMTQTEAARMRGVLLRRKLVRRSPPGRSRSRSRLLLTERGKLASRWLEELQTSLSPDVFDGALERATDAGAEAALALLAAPPDAPPRAERAVEGTFERGLINVWLGTAAFAGAVVVGVLQQTERAGLTALGVGLLLAVFFFARAAVIMVRHARAERAARGGWRPFAWLHHPLPWAHRSRHGGVFP